jgi:hypothetical protein
MIFDPQIELIIVSELAQDSVPCALKQMQAQGNIQG